MKKIANLLLILFPLTAILGIATTLLAPVWPDNPFTTVQPLVFGLGLLLALIIYFGFAFNQLLPKLIFIPLLGYLFWGLLNFWPLEFLTGHSYQLYAFIGQLLLGLLLLQTNRFINKKSWLLVTSQFVGDRFSGRNLFRFCLINIPLLPILFMLLGYSATSSLIEQQTAGFVRLQPNGLYMVEKVYTRGKKTIHLTGMIHLGQQEYYDSLSASLAGKPLLVLAEGVSDRDGLLTGKFGYGKIATLIGLTSQEKMLLNGRQITAERLDQINSLTNDSTDILRADIDINQFDAHTIAVLNALGKYILNSESLIEGYQRFNQWALENMREDSNRLIMSDLVDKRNAAVLGYLPKALAKYDLIVIPWGALHMPGIETAIKGDGFALLESNERLSIDFLLLPYERLWEHLIGYTEDRVSSD